MKNIALIALSSLLFIIGFGCREKTGTLSDVAGTGSRIFKLDPSIKDTVLHYIKIRPNRLFAAFETPAEIKFFDNGRVVDSIMEPNFRMISWYSIRKDTIDLVAHVGELETEALLVRFLPASNEVYYFRASHENQKYFRLADTGAFSSHLEIPLSSYVLKLSARPDSIQKPTIYGSITMESGIFFDQRDSLVRKKVQMKFYFCSQCRSFNYPAFK